jgi:hypothetical protein
MLKELEKYYQNIIWPNQSINRLISPRRLINIVNETIMLFANIIITVFGQLHIAKLKTNGVRRVSKNGRKKETTEKSQYDRCVVGENHWLKICAIVRDCVKSMTSTNHIRIMKLYRNRRYRISCWRKQRNT